MQAGIISCSATQCGEVSTMNSTPERPELVPTSSMVPFFALWTGQVFSLLRSQLSQFALVWWPTKSTGSATILAFGTMMALLPQIFVSPPGRVAFALRPNSSVGPARRQRGAKKELGPGGHGRGVALPEGMARPHDDGGHRHSDQLAVHPCLLASAAAGDAPLWGRCGRASLAPVGAGHRHGPGWRHPRRLGWLQESHL